MIERKPFFDGFVSHQIQVEGASIHAEVGGHGPALLLLHGYPETHVAWHRVVHALAKHYTVVAADLRGYGDSIGPAGDPDHINYCKRTVALDQVQLMRALGFERFAVIGHDRGGRVAYRLCVDHPEAVAGFVSVTVIPTQDMWDKSSMAFGMKAFHWFLFAQPFDMPERLLQSDPAHFLDWTLANMAPKPETISAKALAEYHRAFAQASVRHAMIEDYRAAAGIDLEHDKADQESGRRITCPVQILWCGPGVPSPHPVGIWKKWADDVEGVAIDSGHMIAEEAPGEFIAAVLPFLDRCWRK
jgi:haloacetate dehalogenase